ncbi:phage tail protein [Bacillus cereus]|uniref:phage tail spike protein n=1 Tax=Bacillus mycoides TaxID=1405 RepID=UPI001A356AA2|nr:phage tail spike protein [Bacillus mycoides]MBJ7997689.1 phage tail protein [Bacillus cereus]
MRKPSGELHIVDSKTQRIIASVKPGEYMEDNRHWELNNNIDTLDLKFLESSKYNPYLQQQNLIIKETRPGVLTPYVITEIEKDTNDKTISVFASGDWVLMGSDDFIKPQKFDTWTPQQYIDFACKNTDYERGIVEVTGKRTMTAKEFVSPLSLISELPGLFEKAGEIRYRVELYGANTIKRKVDFIQRRGRDKGKEVTVKKDLNSIRRTENTDAIITALIPYVMGEDADGNEKIITIESVNNGLPYIIDEDAFQRWNRHGKQRFGFYTPETDNKDMTPARLIQLAKTELKKRVEAIVTYEVDAVDLSRIPGFSHELVYEGDTVHIKDYTLTPPLYLEARVIAGDESFKDNRATKYKFGNYREILDANAELRRLYQKILSSLGDKVPKDVFDDLKNRVDNTELTSKEALKRAEQAEKEAKASQDITNKVIEDLKNYQTTIIEQPTVPTAPPHKLEVNKTLWLDSSNPAKKILKIYRGNNTWERIVPDTSQAEKDLAKLIQDVGTVQGEVNQLKKDALKTQEDIKNIGVEVNKKVDQTWLTEEMKKKANTGDVYTKDYVDKNLVGKLIYDADKQANIKAFTDINTKYEQTAEAIKLTATKDELKQTNQNVTNVTKTVNEVKTTAEENSKKITKVEGDFNNMKIGSVNLAIDSEYICDVKNATANYSSLKSLKTSTKIDYRNKKLTLSYILTGNITGKGSNPWMGAELQVKYVDGETQYLSLRRDGSAVGTTWRDALQSGLFTIKDKDIAAIAVTTGSRDVFGNINISHVQLEEGTVPTAWHPATEEAVSTGDFTKVTNEIKQTVDTNTATIEKVQSSFVNANYLANSSANKEYPEFAGDKDGHQASRATMTFENDYIKLVSSDGTDSFYQVGSYKLNDLRGLETGKEYTFSADLVSNAGFAHLVVFEHNGTGWAEGGQNPIKTGETSFVRGSYTFKLKPTTKAFMLRVRFPMSANSTGKYLCFKNLKLEDGSIGTRWTDSTVNNTDFTKTTNEIKQTTEENSQTITKLVTQGSIGTNLIFNSDLSQREGLPIGWTYTNKTDVYYQEPWADDKRAGVFRIARTNLPANSPNAIISGYSKMFPVTINTDYTFSVYIKIPQFDAFVGDRAVIIEFFDAKGTRVDWQDVALTKEELASAKANKWTRIVRTMATKNASATQGGIRLALFNNGEIFYRMPQAELGNMVTGWGLSSSDLVSDQSFTKTTNEIKQGIEENSQTITKVEKKVNDQDASIADVNKKTNEIKQTVDKNSQTITTLSTTQGKQGELIQSNKSSIEQLSNEIQLKVSETQMQDYIGEIGTTNLFLNTPFEIKEIDKDGNVTKRTPSLDKWSFTGNTKPGVIVEASVSRHHAGYNSMHIQSTGQTSNIYVNAFQDAPMLSNSGAYVLSFWMYTENVNAIDEGATVGMYIYGGGSQVGKKEVALKPLLKSGAWVFIVLNVDALTVPTTHARMYLTLVKNGSIYLSQPQYQQGTKPSTYMSNPKDITNYKEMIDLVGSKVATSDYNKQVTKYDTQFEQNTREINLRATKESVYTKVEGDGRYGEKAMVVRHESELKVQSQEISLRVKAGDISSSINQTAQSVLIQAAKINLVGAVTAESINSGILRGTQIYTNADTSGAYLKLEKQHLTLMNGTQPRGYFGFITRSDAGIQSALVLGNDYAVNKQLEGSLVIDHVVQGTAWTNAVASIGIASGGKTGNDINKSSYINFYRYMDKMEIRSQGPIEMNAIKGDITIRSNSSNGISIDSATYMNFNSNTATYTFKNGRNIVDKWTLKMFENGINSGDVDLNIGNQLTLRVARAYPYTMEGLQVKNNKGNDYTGVSCGTLTYGSLSQRSSRDLKTAIKDIEAIDVLETLMELQPRQYFMKMDMNELYAKRQEVIDGGYSEEMPTTKDVHQEYGFIAEEVPEAFATPRRKAVNMYPLITIGIAGTQGVYKKHLALEETVKEQATQLAMQEDRIARLEELLLQQLINKKPEQP